MTSSVYSGSLVTGTMRILLLTAFIARLFIALAAPPVCGYNRTERLGDADIGQYLSCSLMPDSVRENATCDDDGAPMCRTGFTNTSLCSQLCIDINECNLTNRCGTDGQLQCINTIGDHMCTGFPSVGCDDGVITLLDGDSLNEGLLAMCYKGEWILPCSEQWTEMDATVACQQLGFLPGEFHPWDSRPVYANKTFKCDGSESSLDECSMEFSGVCHHVSLTCSNPRPLSPIEVCLPADQEIINMFTSALAERVSSDCSCIYTRNEIRFQFPTVSCPDGQSALQYEIGNYHILPDGAVNNHIQNLLPMFGILNQCSSELQTDCSTNAPLTAILVPIIIVISLLLVAGVIITVVVIRKRRVRMTLQPQDETKTFNNPTYHVTALPHPDLTADSYSTEPEKIVINTLYTSPVPHPTNETLPSAHQYDEPQLKQTLRVPTANSQGEYAEIDDYSKVQNSQGPQPYEVPAVPTDDATVPESADQEAYAVLNQQKAQYATLEPSIVDPQDTEPAKDGYSHLQH